MPWLPRVTVCFSSVTVVLAFSYVLSHGTQLRGNTFGEKHCDHFYYNLEDLRGLRHFYIELVYELYVPMTKIKCFRALLV